MKHPWVEQIGVVASLLRELCIPPTALSPLMAHAEAVRRDADRLGLVAVADADVVPRRHTADSLLFALARAPLAGESWADIGTGAGFPGMVLAIAYPATSFLLIEPQQRRAGFLEVQVADLGLANVTVTTQRVEAIAPAFDVATARALAEPTFALESAWRLVAPDGCAVIAVGDGTPEIGGTQLVELARPGVDSSGRLLIMARPRQGA